MTKKHTRVVTASTKEYVSTKYNRLSKEFNLLFSKEELYDYLNEKKFLANRETLLKKKDRRHRVVARVLCDQSLVSVALTDLVLEINEGSGFYKLVDTTEPLVDGINISTTDTEDTTEDINGNDVIYVKPTLWQRIMALLGL